MTALPPSSGPVEPPDGYQVPPTFGTPPPPSPGDPGADDPLVPPPYGGLRPAWERLKHLLSVSGRPVMLILLLTFALPQLAQAIVVGMALDGIETVGGGFVLPGEDNLDAAGFGALTAGTIVVGVALFAVITLVASIGWGASIWAITQAATGAAVTVPDALAAGARRMFPMFGWYLLYSLMVAVGILACLLPGIYLAVAGCLFSFAVMYEPGRNPLGRSFSLVHKAFGAVLGRALLLILFMSGVLMVLGLCLGFALVGGGEPAGFGAELFVDGLLTLAMVPLYAVLLTGLLLTYTQVRARQETVSTGQLHAALQPVPGGPPGFAGGPASPIS